MTFATVITAAYQAESFIDKAVRSVIAQSYGDWEMIIVSDDGVDYREILQGYGIHDARLRFYSTGIMGAGPAVARNIGLLEARHDIIINLDSDDSIASDYIEHILPVAIQHDLATPAIQVMQDGEATPSYQRQVPDDIAAFSLRDAIRYCPTFAPIAFDRSKFNQQWPLLHYGEDLLLWLRLLDHAHVIPYVRQAKYHYTHRRHSLSRPQEPTTRGLCARREKMVEWIKQNTYYGYNKDNYSLLISWLESCNEMEKQFDYQLVDIELFMAENNRRFDQLIGESGSYNTAHS
jgi:glycosyltransferase involved in cell wall biosynthesis